MSTSNGKGTAEDATVSTAAPDAEARQRLLALAEDMPEGEARDRILALADTLTDPRETFLILAEESERAAEDIKTKMAGMDETRKSKLAEAKEYRRMAKGTE